MHRLTIMGTMLCDVVVVRAYAPGSHVPLIMMTMRKRMLGFYRYGAPHGGRWGSATRCRLLVL